MARTGRFWERVVQRGDCWIYTGPLDRGGYGRAHIGDFFSAHRYAYSVMRAEIPDGLSLDHLCRVRACVNPDHLDPVPVGINAARANTGELLTAPQSRCKRGHEFTPENTRLYAGRRHCLACKCLRNAMRYRQSPTAGLTN